MEISLVMMLFMVKGKMRVTLPATQNISPTSPLVTHTDSHIVSTTNSIVTPSMTLTSPNKFL